VLIFLWPTGGGPAGNGGRAVAAGQLAPQVRCGSGLEPRSGGRPHQGLPRRCNYAGPVRLFCLCGALVKCAFDVTRSEQQLNINTE
jgi:hypothetical protein